MKYTCLILLFALIACGEVPDGKDSNGFYKYEELCVKSHTITVMQPIMIGKTMGVTPSARTICDSSIIGKRYIPVEEIDKNYLDGYIKGRYK